MSPVAASSAWLLAADRPRLDAFATTRTHGNSAASISTVPSPDALSTTTVSQLPLGGFSASEVRQRRSTSRERHATTASDSRVGTAAQRTRGAGSIATGTAASGKRAGSSISSSDA